MTREEFKERVGRYSEFVRAHPALYRSRVAAFASLGYAVYVGIILAIGALLAGYVALLVTHPGFWVVKIGWKLGIPTFFLVVSLVKALRVEAHLPLGFPLRRSDVPAFFALLDDLSRKVGAPKFEAVLLDDAFNAGVVQLPRFGLLGSRHFLVVGMPLMQALSKDDFAAVVSHELGHSSKNHSRFAAWIYHIVGSYVRVLQASGGNGPIERFLAWYVPRLDALSFPLRRHDEFEADAASARAVGARRAAQALANVEVRGAMMPEFWKSVNRTVQESPTPPAHAFVAFRDRCRALESDTAEAALERALAEETGVEDTHPALRDRLAALGETPELEAAAETSAAEELFGERYGYLTEQAGYVWVQKSLEAWQTEHRRLQGLRADLGKLEEERRKGPLSEEQAFAYAYLGEEVVPDQDPLPLYRAVLELFPNNAAARLAAGRLLTERNDPEAPVLLEPLTKNADRDLRLAARVWLARFRAQSGDEEGAAQAWAHAGEAFAEKAENERARTELRTSDTFVPHGFTDEELAKLREDLALLTFVKQAYLVRKRISDTESAPVLAFLSKWSARATDENHAGRTERTQKTVTLPAGTWVLNLDVETRFRAPIQRVEGALVYEAG